MGYETLKKEWQTNDNWRAHIAKYVNLNKKLRGSYTPEQYCEENRINCEAFKVWLEYLKKEDKYVFYVSFAPEYLRRAKRSVDLLNKHIDVPELGMALMRDAIIAYAAPFRNSRSRIFTKYSLGEVESLVPAGLQEVHKRICEERDTIVAHCDIEVRSPRVGMFGISIRMAGHYWEDYKRLIPEFEKLILAVQEELERHNQKHFGSVKTYFKDFLNPPECTSIDPGPPSKNNSQGK